MNRGKGTAHWKNRVRVMARRSNELIPELQDWNDGAGIDLTSWLSAIGDYAHAIGYVQLFWPDFFEYEDCIFRRKIDATTFNAWLQSCADDKTAIEATANHVHIVDLFPNATAPTKDQIIYLGRKLSEIWQSKLKRDFPDRQFIVAFSPDGDVEDPVAYEITFFQARD